MGNVPRMPRWLGLAGLLPQFICVAVLYWGPDYSREPAQIISVAYAALILAFLGGTWWGIAAMAPAAERRRALGWVWIAALFQHRQHPLLGKQCHHQLLVILRRPQLELEWVGLPEVIRGGL